MYRNFRAFFHTKLHYHLKVEKSIKAAAISTPVLNTWTLKKSLPTKSNLDFLGFFRSNMRKRGQLCRHSYLSNRLDSRKE